MKKVMVLLVLVVLMAVSMAVSVIAAPQPPFILFGHVDWNDQMLYGSTVEIKVNGVPNTVTTDDKGYWMYQISSYSFGSSVVIRVTEGCGTGDTCSQSFTIGSLGYEDYAEVDFSITGVLACPPVQCDCGGGGGGGGSCYYTESKCNDRFPPDDCEVKNCPVPEYTLGNCRSLFPCEDSTITCDDVVSCPEGKVCDVCDDVVPEGLTGGQILIWIISLIGIGGIGIYSGTKITNDRITKVRGVTYRIAVERDGDVREEHRHYGLRNYHSINTVHKEAHERHPKGEKFPLFIKDNLGVYNYVPAKG